jgi:uroporphyrinogen decarboxylase
VHQLRGVDDAMPSLEFQGAAMRATRSVLSNEKSLIGFVGGPWTLFGYAVEGSHKGGLIQAKRNLALYSAFCANLLPLIERNIELQLKNGAEIVMIFDTAAGELAPELYSEMVAPTVEALVRKFPGRIGYYAKAIQASYLSAPFFSEPGLLAGLGFDHHWSMRALLNGSAFKNKHNGFIQGNFDQALLFSDIDQLARRLKQYLEPIRQLDVDSRAGWVCGLGHGVLPQTPEANVRSFVTTIREVFSR